MAASDAQPAVPVSAGPVRLAVQATRPLYLPTSVIPGAIGVAVAGGVGGVSWAAALAALVALACIHAGTDVINDVEDFARGVDDANKIDNSRVFNTGLMSLDAGRRLAASLFAAGVAIGVVISLFQGPAVLAYGLVGSLTGLAYSAGPRPLKYAGLGDVAIVPVMGPLITQGAYTAATGDAFHASAFWVGLAPGFLIAAVLAANNLADIDGDRASGVRTLAVRLGFAGARVEFLSVLTASYVSLVAVWAAGLLSAWVLVPLLTVPLAVGRARLVLAAEGERDPSLEGLAARAAQLHLAATFALLVGVVLDAVV